MNTSPSPQRSSLRERHANAVRDEIVHAAIRRFLAQGFDETTVDDIAHDIGASRRTIFRYFGTKEDIILSWPLEYVDGLKAAVAASSGDKSPLARMREVLIQHIVAKMEAHPGALLLGRLIQNTPRLRTRSYEITDAWEAALAEGLIEHDPDHPARARLTAAVAVSVARQGARRWLEADGSITLTGSINRAFDELSQVGP